MFLNSGKPSSLQPWWPTVSFRFTVRIYQDRITLAVFLGPSFLTVWFRTLIAIFGCRCKGLCMWVFVRSNMWPWFLWINLQLLGIEGRAWCQSDGGSCIGQRHRLEEKPQPSLKGENFGGTLRFADWDRDGDTDLLVQQQDSIWFHERSGESFLLQELAKLPADLKKAGIEVADWNRDKEQLISMLLHVVVFDC